MHFDGITGVRVGGGLNMGQLISAHCSIAIPLENRKPKGLVIFSGGIATQHWAEMS